jgi:hypothetical protein
MFENDDIDLSEKNNPNTNQYKTPTGLDLYSSKENN